MPIHSQMVTVVQLLNNGENNGTKVKTYPKEKESKPS